MHSRNSTLLFCLLLDYKKIAEKNTATMKVKTILVSQPEPKVENSPYFDLQQKHKVKVDFRPFIHVEGVNDKDVRLQKIDLKN